MDFPSTRTGGSSVPRTDGTLGYSTEPETDDASFSLLPYDQRAFAHPHPTPSYGSIHPHFVPTAFGLTSDGSSSFPSAVPASPLPANHSSWNGYPSYNIHPPVSSPILGPSEPAVYAAQNASGYIAVAMGSRHTQPHEQRQQGQGVFPSTAVSTPRRGPTGSHAEHVDIWYSVLLHAVVSGPRVFVPQTLYQPHAQGDRERYVALATLYHPIIFIREGSPEWGIPIQHLLSNQPVQLVGGREPAFTSCGPSIGIRLHWPGYQPFHKQVSTKDFTSRRNIISKAKLAKVVAKFVAQCILDMSTQAMQVGFDGQWRVGPSNIRVDDVILVSLHHVSRGSWQPHLRLRRAVGTVVAAASQNLHVETGMHS